MTTQIQIEQVYDRMDKGFSDLKEMLTRYDERLRLMENREAAFNPVLKSRVDAAWNRLDAHSEEIKTMSESVSLMSRSMGMLESVAKWLLGISTAIIISMSLAVITGRVEILFK